MHIIIPKLKKYQKSILKKIDHNNEYHIHGYAWFETYVTAIEQFDQWYDSLENPSQLDTLIHKVGINEYVADLRDGIAMSQTERFRLDDLGYEKFDLIRDFKEFNMKNKKKMKIVRFGNVFGSSGSAINNFMDKINNEEIVQITDKKASRYFMTITEACHLVLQTTSINSKKNIFILNMGKPINIFSLAKNLAKIKVNLNPNYKFKYAFTGLQPGEKLKETLKGKREVLKMMNNEIFEVSQNYQTKESFNLYYKNLVTKYNEFNKKKLINHLKEISKY